jgi:hypothetical protein
MGTFTTKPVTVQHQSRITVRLIGGALIAAAVISGATLAWRGAGTDGSVSQPVAAPAVTVAAPARLGIDEPAPERFVAPSEAPLESIVGGMGEFYRDQRSQDATPGPTWFLVATEAEQDAFRSLVDERLGDSAVMVASDEYAQTLMQEVNEANSQRAANGLPPIQVVDLR